MSFKSGFITGQSISRRAGGGGGFGGSALSIATMTQKARGVIRPAPSGGGSSDPFKTALREIATPTIEFTFADELVAAESRGDANLDNKGASGSAWDADAFNDGVVESDSTGDFDGYFPISVNNQYIEDSFGGSKAVIDKSKDRTWIWVFDVTGNLPNGTALCYGNTGTTNNAWGWMWAGTGQTNAQAGVFNTRYFFSIHPTFGDSIYNGWATPLKAANCHHTVDDDNATDFVTVTGSEGAAKRSVLMMTFNKDATKGTIRWKQTGDPAGHTVMTGSCAVDAGGSWAVYTYWAGYSVTSQNITGAKFKYIGVLDEVLTEANFDTLADIALGN